MLDIHQIRKILPHRYPLLLVDRIEEMDENHVIGTKNVSANEPYFQGHFPDFPVMPGVLMMESAFQTCGWLLCVADRFQQGFPRLSDVRNVKFGSFVRPGDTLQLVT